MRVTVNGWAWLRLDELDADNLSSIKDRLTMVQKVSPEYKSRVEPAILTCFVEDAERGFIGVPREFFLERVSRQHEITYKVSDGLPWPEKAPVEVKEGEAHPPWVAHRTDDPFELTLYDTQNNKPVLLFPEQQAALDATSIRMRQRPGIGGIIQAPTGWGKTVFGLIFARMVRKKTAILVHREFLLHQWKRDIRRFLPDAKVGWIFGDKWKNVEDAHFVMIMTETLASWIRNGTVREEIRDMFGLVITDEVHRASAPTWAPVMPLFQAAMRIGITAKPRRADGLDKAFFYHIGPVVYAGKQLQMSPLVRRVWTNFKVNHPRLNTDLMSREMATRFLAASSTYNQDIVDQIMMALRAGRKIIVYSHQIEHLRRLKQETDSQFLEKKVKTDFFIGGMTEADEEEAATADVIFATYQKCKDALNIPELDTVVLATPVRDPEQPAGRALRFVEGKKQPIIVDIRADAVPICKDYAQSRDRAYERLYGLKPPQNS